MPILQTQCVSSADTAEDVGLSCVTRSAHSAGQRTDPALLSSLPSSSGIKINSHSQCMHYLDLLPSPALFGSFSRKYFFIVGIYLSSLWENSEWIPALLFKILVGSLI